MRKILVTNDDGIDAPGLIALVRAARMFGEVLVVAPAKQRSAVSHSITLHRDMILKKVDFPFDAEAYSLDGMPADCVRASYLGLWDEVPDAVLSGVNEGANTGFDIMYSATVGAGMEAVLYRVPVICFSKMHKGTLDVTEKYLPELIGELLEKGCEPGHLWNVNFPSCPVEECGGVLYERFPSEQAMYDDIYVRAENAPGEERVILRPLLRDTAEEGSDMKAVLDGFVSVGSVRIPVALS